MVQRSCQCIARASWKATQRLSDGGLPIRPLHEPVYHLLEQGGSAWEQPTPTTHTQLPGAGLTSCITPSPDMTTSASQRPSSSACTSSLAWFRRSVGDTEDYGVGAGYGCSLHPIGEALTSEHECEGDIGLGQEGLYIASEEFQGFALAPAWVEQHQYSAGPWEQALEATGCKNKPEKAMSPTGH